MNEWINLLFEWVASASILGQLQRFWPLVPLLKILIPKSLKEAAAAHALYASKKLDKRLSKTAPRPDFITPTLKALNTPEGISEGELLETVRTLLVGGAETVATALCGVTYYLCRNPSAFDKLKAKIRGTFTSYEEISKESVIKLDYLTAVINETLRIWPVLPGNLRRLTPPTGCSISGHHIPPHTIVAYDMYAAGHSESNFHLASSFRPERYLPSPPSEFANDSIKSYQPFGMGPRSCIGKNLAYLELRMILARMILAKLIWSFELELGDGCWEWVMGMKVFSLFEKPSLMMRLTPVER